MFCFVFLVARGRRSNYFPSPPESAEPPILLEAELELKPETKPELEPEMEECKQEPEPEPESDRTPVPPLEPLESVLPPEETASYEWPLHLPNDNSNIIPRIDEEVTIYTHACNH